MRPWTALTSTPAGRRATTDARFGPLVRRTSTVHGMRAPPKVRQGVKLNSGASARAIFERSSSNASRWVVAELAAAFAERRAYQTATPEPSAAKALTIKAAISTVGLPPLPLAAPRPPRYSRMTSWQPFRVRVAEVAGGELWSDDCEVLAWVIKRFESDGDPIMAGHVRNAFPDDSHDAVRQSLR